MTSSPKVTQKPKTKNGMNETKCRFPNIYQANINALVLERKIIIEIQALHFPEIRVGFKFVLFKTKVFFLVKRFKKCKSWELRVPGFCYSRVFFNIQE